MEARKFDVVVVGELNPDLILSGNVMPEFGQVEKLVDTALLTIGSSSAIFACGAARLGLRVAFIGKVGKDLFGGFMRRALDEYGIDTNGIVEDGHTPTGISVIFSDGNDRAILTYPGTISSLEFSEIDQEIIRMARHMHVGSYYMQAALQPDLPKLFDIAHGWGTSVFLDPNYDITGNWDGLSMEAISKADVFLPNLVECKMISGRNELEQAVNYFKDKVSYLGVKLGKGGGLLAHDSQIYQSEGIKIDVVDTVGAGDSFDAGFIYGYLAEWKPERILKMANICGGLSTRQAGGTTAQPTLQEVLEYL